MTKQFVSISKNPGKIGKFFYNYFFKKYNIDAIYNPLASDNLKKTLENLNDVDGISVSMPFKKEVIDFLNFKNELVEQYQSCNTIKIVNNEKYGYNTDYYGMKYVLSKINKSDKISLLGDGSIATMFKFNLTKYEQYSRKYNNWDKKNTPTDVVINCTPLGNIGKEKLFEKLPNCKVVIDLSFNNLELSKQTKNIGATYISGIDFYKFTFINQFKIYTNISIPEKEFDEASILIG